MFTTAPILRSLHTTMSHLARHSRKNPGMGKQLKAFEHEEEFTQDPEGHGNLEADFMHVHHTQREHEREMQTHRDVVRLQMVKQKYFKSPQLPNLLTYAEKEQIRLLHTRDPNEWAVERLVESFPATHDIVEKLIKLKWRPRNIQRIRAHDEAVMRNWEQLRSNTLNVELPRELKEHLIKFAKRRKEDLQTPSKDLIESIRLEVPKPQHNEFQSIITSCSKYQETPNGNEKETTLQLKSGIKVAPRSMRRGNDDETYLLEKVHDKRSMRIHELKQMKLSPEQLSFINKDHDTSAAQLNNDALHVVENPGGTGVLPKLNYRQAQLSDLNYGAKFESNEIVISTEDQKRFEMSRVKNHIHIPRKVWRRGATYRIEDSYYDDDGEFLYRVPGMTT